MIRKNSSCGIWMAALLWGCLLPLMAAPARFTTQRLRGMATLMKLEGLDTLSAASDCRSGFTYNGRTLHLTTNDWGEVSHIGYLLFEPGLRLVQPSPLYDFLERYMLELDLPSDISRSLRLERDQVHVQGNLGVLASLDGTEEFVIDRRPYLKYRVYWTRGGKELLSLSFNMECQLFTGCITTEQETNLVRDLKRAQPYAVALPDKPTGGELTKADDFYILHGRNYMQDHIRNDLFFRKAGERFVLVEDAEHPLQAIPDILLTGQSTKDYKLDVCLDKYGYKTEDFTVTWKQWVAFCKEEGCEFFFGVKSRTDEAIVGTFFAVNDKMGYNHMMNVTFPLSLLKGGDGHLAARLYAYIPLHNVSEKYFKFDYKK